MTLQSNIDLNTCVRGQKVKLRNGTIATYNGVIDENEIYTHAVNGYSYTRRGTFWMEDGRTSTKDVVEILPMKEEPAKPTPELTHSIETGIDLNTCVPGQKVKLRDGTIATYNGLIDQNEIYTHAVDDYSYTGDGCFWNDDRISSKDVVKILPMEKELTKPIPELTHSITDQIDVSNPDHVSIIPHEHGVTISIKKGLTTISWRHYNS
jgi:hypothetical protein